MSKKIFIPLENIRSCLHDLFHEYLDEQYDLERTKRPYELVDDDDYDYMDDDEVLWLMQQGYVFPGMDAYLGALDDDDDGDTIWPLNPKKGKKKGKRTANDIYSEFWEKEERRAKRKHHKKGKAKMIDINTPYSGNEEDPDEVEYSSYDDLDSDGIYDGKIIWFYPNYRDKDDRLEFNTLSAFDEFCADEGFVVPPYIGEHIAYRRVSHCCLNPYAREQGVFEIMAEESYADMMYEACDVTELSQ
jgi:hypothetical protein